MSKKQESYVFWLAVILSVIGILAVVVLALNAIGLF